MIKDTVGMQTFSATASTSGSSDGDSDSDNNEITQIAKKVLRREHTQKVTTQEMTQIIVK